MVQSPGIQICYPTGKDDPRTSLPVTLRGLSPRVLRQAEGAGDTVRGEGHHHGAGTRVDLSEVHGATRGLKQEPEVLSSLLILLLL